MASEMIRKGVVDAFMALLAEKRFDAIGLDEIAARAAISLADLRDAFDGKVSILADFSRGIDKALLTDLEPANAEESHRDRLFDITMRRLDLLSPYRAAIGSLEESARRDPGLALCLNRTALDSARFMLAAAGIGTGGPVGAARAQGYVLLLAKVIPVWRDDHDPDQSRTMAALDRALERAETMSKRADRLAGAVCAIARQALKRRPARREPPPAENAAV